MIQVLFFQTFISYLTICNSCIYRISDHKIYEINPSNGLIIRLDSIANDTLYKGDLNLFRNHAIVEVNNNILYRYGGYGYNQTNNKVDYFDKNENNWIYLELKEYEESKGFFNGYSVSIDDNIFFFGGKYIDPLNGRLEIENKKIIALDVKSKQLKVVGQINYNLKSLRFLAKFNHGYLFYDKLHIHKFDFLNNTIEKFKLPSTLNNFNTVDKSLIFVHDKILSLKNNYQAQLELKNPISIKPLVTKPYEYYKYLSVLLFPFVLYFIYHSRKVKTLFLEENHMKYKDKMTTLSLYEYEILKAFITKKELLGNEILQIINNNEISYSQLTRIRQQTIKNLNSKLSYLLDNSEETIVNDKLLTDKRNKMYSIHISDDIKIKIRKSNAPTKTPT